MVIVETIALSTMVSNDLVLPVLLRRWQGLPPEADMGKLLLRIRRGAIIAILLLGYLYYHLAGDAYALVAIGLISFAAVAQFAPPVIAGLYWRGGTRDGALAGLTAGFAVWLYTLLIPSFAKSGWLPLGFLEQGPFGIELLKPQALLGLAGLNEITHALDLEPDRQYRRLPDRVVATDAQRGGDGSGQRLRGCPQEPPSGPPGPVAG